MCVAMKPTIKDIASEAGVGLGTVSRVLNDHPRVAASTRDRVLKAIKDLDYTPSSAARSLSGGPTRSIAVIAPFFTRAAFAERLTGIESVASAAGYDLIVYNVDSAEKRDRYLNCVPDRRRVDGVIIISLPPKKKDLLRLAQAEVPIVLLDVNGGSAGPLNCIVTDDVAGGAAATRHLIALGHRRIAFLGDQPAGGFMFRASHDRYQGYCQAMTEAGLPIVASYHVEGPFSRQTAHALALDLLDLPEPPTAIFASSDTQAVGALEAARERGISVPDDLSVVGYDDIELADFFGLTTVRQLLFESGKRSVEMLLQRMTQPRQEPTCQGLPFELIVRGTTSPPR